MNRVNKIFMIILIIISNSCSTTNKCQKLLSEEIDTRFVQNNKDEFIKKIENLIDCEFDSIDKEVFFGNDKDGMIIDYLFQIFKEINKSTTPKNNITFLDIKQLIIELTKSEEYKVGRQIVIAKNKIIDQPAKLNTWAEDYKLLVQMNLTELDIAKIKKLVEQNENRNWTYNEIFQELMSIYETTNSMECPIPSYHNWFVLPYNLDGYYELSEGMTCSKISNKPVLVYFSGHGSVESREFEAFIMSDEKVLNLIKQKYIITNLTVDDKSEALPKYFIYSEQTNDTIKKIGEINQYYQKKLFKDNIQPAFYIIDSLGNQINNSYYFNNSIDAFRDYLEKGIEIYYKLK